MLMDAVDCCWLLLDVAGCCWLLLVDVVVGCCWMLLDILLDVVGEAKMTPQHTPTVGRGDTKMVISQKDAARHGWKKT